MSPHCERERSRRREGGPDRPEGLCNQRPVLRPRCAAGSDTRCGRSPVVHRIPPHRCGSIRSRGASPSPVDGRVGLQRGFLGGRLRAPRLGWWVDHMRGWTVMMTALGFERSTSRWQLILHSNLLEELLYEPRRERCRAQTRDERARLCTELRIYRLHLLSDAEREPLPPGMHPLRRDV